MVTAMAQSAAPMATSVLRSISVPWLLLGGFLPLRLDYAGFVACCPAKFLWQQGRKAM